MSTTITTVVNTPSDEIVNRTQNNIFTGDNTFNGDNTHTGVETFTDLRTSGSFTRSYSAKTTTYSIVSTDSIIDCTSGTFTVTLPTAVDCIGKVYDIKNSGTGVITIATTSSQTIDGGSSGTITLDQYEGITVVSNNSNWIII